MRLTVSVDMEATIQSETSFRASSWQSQRQRDLPNRSGISQASLTRCKATSGGKRWLSASPRLVFKAVDSMLHESRNPQAHDSSPHADNTPGFRKTLAFTDQQDGPGSSHQTSRQAGCAQPTIEFSEFFLAKSHDMRRFPSTHVLVLLAQVFQSGLQQTRGFVHRIQSPEFGHLIVWSCTK